MKKFILLSIITLSMSQVLANVITYQCGPLKLSTAQGSGKIQIVGLPGAENKGVLGAQTRYNPTEKHAGSTRYDVSSICDASGNVYVILDSNLSTGKADGAITIQSNCDADGGAPTFNRYSCQAK